MKHRMKTLALAAACLTAANAQSQQRPALYVNADVTTHMIMPEQLKMVDISTDIIAGDQCADNMVRIKPVAPDSIDDANRFFLPGQFLGTVTLIGERHMAQYDLFYNDNPTKAEAMYRVTYDDSSNYSNPDVAMPENEMANYAWAVSNTRRKYNTVRSSAYGISASVYNIYSIGNYFFIDLYLKNNTNIEYDIAQMRVSLTDKKETKATNSQTLELTPAYVLNNDRSFKKDYRQVIVLDKLTFPEEKVLNIEISEDQISGRVITVPIEYDDILHADCFDGTKKDAYYKVSRDYRELLKENKRLTGELRDRQKSLNKANAEIEKAKSDIRELDGKLKKSKARYVRVERKLEAFYKLDRQMRQLNDDIARIDSEETPDGCVEGYEYGLEDLATQDMK